MKQTLIFIALISLELILNVAIAKSKHCGMASNFVESRNFIAANNDAFFHLSTSSNILYILPRQQKAQNETEGVFYYIVSLSSTCDNWTIILRSEEGDEILLVGWRTTDQNKFNNGKQAKLLKVIFDFQPKDEYLSSQEELMLIPVNLAYHSGITTDSSTIEVSQILNKTAFAICRKEFGNGEKDNSYQNSDSFKNCVSYYSGEKP